MTQRFLEEFRERIHCGQCKAAPAEGRKTCPKHLEYAKAQNRIWVKVRRDKGLCISCDRRGYKGECRCLLHKGGNQAKCRAWVKKNRDWMAFKSAFERLWFQIDGVCRVCRANPTNKSTVCCDGCLQRQNKLKRASDMRMRARA